MKINYCLIKNNQVKQVLQASKLLIFVFGVVLSFFGR